MSKLKGTDFLNRFFMALACVLAAGVLFLGSPVQVHAEPKVLGSQPSGTTQTPADDEEEQAPADEAADSNEAAGSENGAASQVTSATVSADSVRVRRDASTSAGVAGTAKSGQEVTVTGEKTDSDGKVWYEVSFTDGGETIEGYIRSDLVEAHETVVEPETPAEEPEAPAEEPEQQPEPAVPTDDYYVEFADDGTGSGTNAWYLVDNTMGTRYQVSELLNAVMAGTEDQDSAGQASTLRIVVIGMAVVILILIIVVTVFIIKLRNMGEAYDDDDDEDDDDYDDEDEEEERPRRGKGRFLRKEPRRSRYDDDDDDYDDEAYDDEDEEDYDDEDEEEEVKPRSRGAKASREQKDKNWQSKNFLDDDDLEFEFLDLK